MFIQALRWDSGVRACRAHAVRITSRHSRSASPTNILLRLTYIKQQAPCPTLVEVTDRQAVFLRHDVKGTMLGYFSPVMFHGAAVAGFHEHFPCPIVAMQVSHLSY